jgi:ABC-type lipoprotein release transport system permease subunit
LFAPSVLVIAIVLLFSIVYSMLAGLIPSLRAARLNAVKALRKE